MSNTFKKPDLRCPVCLAEFYLEKKPNAMLGRCPSCSTEIARMLVREDGYIFINWQQLRTLAIYAARWSGSFDLNKKGNMDAMQALTHILMHLQTFQPKGSAPLLPQILHLPHAPAQVNLSPEIIGMMKAELKRTNPPSTGKPIVSPYYVTKDGKNLEDGPGQ
jgi:hypothetical protein